MDGDIPLFRFKGIDVQLHASFVIYAVLVLVFGVARGSPWQVNVESMIILWGIVLIHEFGHCFTARWVGGDADHILMTPLGGLAFATPPRRPLPTFLTVAGGPAVNVIICLITGSLLWAILRWGHTSLYRSLFDFDGWLSPQFHLSWIYVVSMALLLFNLLPIFPLDGGRMLQSILWPKFGWYKSMLFACNTGIIGAVVMAMISIATGQVLMIILWGSLLFYCVQLLRRSKPKVPRNSKIIVRIFRTPQRTPSGVANKGGSADGNRIAFVGRLAPKRWSRKESMRFWPRFRRRE